MSEDYVALYGYPGGAWVGLRELCGHDQEAVDGAGTVAAIRLLDRLLVAAPGQRGVPVEAAKLTASDRDRLLAAVYVRTYGPVVESTVDCAPCGQPYDIDFSLPDLLEGLWEEAGASPVERGPEGTYKLPDGRSFRLPTGEDEIAVWHLPPKEAERELMARCTLVGDPARDAEDVQAAMEQVAPVLNLDMDAQCPECGEGQSVHFDMQTYLLAALASERDQVARQVHLLASAYGWSLDEILGLPRSRRHAYAALIEAASAPTPRGIE
jgi:hypothetical protein